VEIGSDAQFSDMVRKFGKFDNPEFKNKSVGNSEDENNDNNNNNDHDNDDNGDGNNSRDSHESRASTNGNSSDRMKFKTDCIIIKNLDTEAKIEDVEKFFCEVNIQKNEMRTHILLDKQGEHDK
jgi:hypothetical protein